MSDWAENKKAVVALCVALAAPCEGLREWAYKDPVGIPTICFGSTKGVRLGDHKTPAECKDLLTQEMSDVIEHVNACRPGLPTQTLAAFADAAYNLGPAIACDSAKSTAARLLAAGQFQAACGELPKWDKARFAGVMVSLPGLTKRRALERDLCLQGAA